MTLLKIASGRKARIASLLLSASLVPLSGAIARPSPRVNLENAVQAHVLPEAPNLARGEGLMQPDMMLLVSIKTGKNAMPGFMGILKDQDILDVIAYTRTLIGTVSNLNR